MFEHQNSRFHNYPDLALRFTETATDETAGDIHADPECSNAHNEELVVPMSLEFWIYLLFCTCKFSSSLVLVCVAGLMSGLTVGMMGIDHLVLELKIESRDTKPEE